MVIEFKFSQRLLIIIKLATILGWVSGLIKIEALKRSIATTAGEIDKFVTMNKKYNKLKMLSKSYDQRSIPAYLQVFNGKTGKFAGLSNYTINDNFKEAVRMLIDREGINTMNGHALFDLMVTQSTFIKEYDGIDFKGKK